MNRLIQANRGRDAGLQHRMVHHIVVIERLLFLCAALSVLTTAGIIAGSARSMGLQVVD